MPGWSKAFQWDGNRVFVTTAFGCPARCQFCYLDTAGYAEARVPELSTTELLAGLLQTPRFHSGADGTLISVGCLGEPLAPHAAAATTALLESLAILGNPIQISTRWVIRDQTLSRFLAAAKLANASIFHSFSTIRHARAIEPGTPSIDLRRDFIMACAQVGLESILYIKPFLPSVTPQSLREFLHLSREAHIRYAVVGPLFAEEHIAQRLDRVLPSGWQDSQFGISSLPFSSSPAEFGADSPELAQFTESLERAGICVTRHGWQMADAFRRRRVDLGGS
jgi:DNA repair photolyase